MSDPVKPPIRRVRRRLVAVDLAAALLLGGVVAVCVFAAAVWLELDRTHTTLTGAWSVAASPKHKSVAAGIRKYDIVAFFHTTTGPK